MVPTDGSVRDSAVARSPRGASPADWRHAGHQIRSSGGPGPLLVLRQQFSGVSRGPYRVDGARKVAAATRTGRPDRRRQQGSACHAFVDRPSEVIDFVLNWINCKWNFCNKFRPWQANDHVAEGRPALPGQRTHPEQCGQHPAAHCIFNRCDQWLVKRLKSTCTFCIHYLRLRRLPGVCQITRLINQNTTQRSSNLKLSSYLS